jgi:hypothetical protein
MAAKSAPQADRAPLSDQAIDEIESMLAAAPDCEAESGAVEVALQRFRDVGVAADQKLRNRRAAGERLGQINQRIAELTFRAELGEQVADELAAAQVERREAEGAMTVADDPAIAAKVADERHDALWASYEVLYRRYGPWRTALSKRLDEIEDEAHRALTAIGVARYRLDLLGELGTVPRYTGHRPHPTLTLGLGLGIDRALDLSRDVMRVVTRRR